MKVKFGKSQFVRGFILGQLHESGSKITTRLVRERMRVSKATAKRDLAMLRRLIGPTVETGRDD